VTGRFGHDRGLTPSMAAAAVSARCAAPRGGTDLQPLCRHLSHSANGSPGRVRGLTPVMSASATSLLVG
jgi:hypothetical protein